MVYLNIEGEVFEKHKKAAEETSIESCGEEDGKNSFQFNDLNMVYTEPPHYDEETNCISYGGTLKIGDDDLGYFSDEIELDFDTIISIIEIYRRKLGKLKTVLEATK